MILNNQQETAANAIEGSYVVIADAMDHAVQKSGATMLDRCFYIFPPSGLTRISHTPERKGEQSVMPDFENREAANMRFHIGNERFTKDGMTNCSDFPRQREKCGLDKQCGLIQADGTKYRELYPLNGRSRVSLETVYDDLYDFACFALGLFEKDTQPLLNLL